MQSAPLVTVAIPTRNRSSYVERAIRTVLAQTFEDLEVLVSDNASDDDTLERLRAIDDKRLVVIRQYANLGMARNWNACLERARGRFFLLVSDDDYLHRSAVERLIEPLTDEYAGTPSQTIGLAWCPARLVDGDDRELWNTLNGPSLESGVDFLAGMFAGTRGPRFCGIMVRTADARAAGGFREHYSPICDIGNWGRIALQYEYVACVSEPLVSYTMHFGSTSSTTTCATWRRAGEQVFEDLLPLAALRGAVAHRTLQRARTPFISALIATVIMQSAGKPGWLASGVRESLHAARYMLAPSTVLRLVKNAAKLKAISGRS